MRSYFFETLFHPGNGVIFSRLVIDLVAFLLIFYVVGNIFIPIIQNYRLAIYLDHLCGKDPRHWFYGHLLKVELRVISLVVAVYQNM